MDVSDVYRYVIEDVVSGLKSEVDEEILHQLRSTWESKLIQTGVFSINSDTLSKENSSSLSPKRKLSDQEEDQQELSSYSNELPMPSLYSSQPITPMHYASMSDLFSPASTLKSPDFSISSKSPSTPTNNNNISPNYSILTSNSSNNISTLSNVQVIQGVDPRYTSTPPKPVTAATTTTNTQTPSPASSSPIPRSLKLPSFQFVGLSFNPIPFTRESFSGKPAPYLPPVTTGNQVPYVAPVPETPTTKRARTSVGKQYDGIDDHDDFSTPFFDSEIMPLHTGTPTGLTPALPTSLDDENLNSDLDEDDKEPETRNIIMCQFEKVTRVKNKRKCILKDGIMHLNGRDYVFSRANGECEF